MKRTISYAEIRERHLHSASIRSAVGMVRKDKVHDEEQLVALIRLAQARQAREQQIIMPNAPGEPRRIVWSFPTETP